MLTLAGKGAIVAGTKRIGATVVQRLAREGVRFAITYRNSRTEAEALATEISSLTDRVSLIQADLALEEDIKRAVSQARAKLGDLSFCINMASDYPRTPFETLDAKAWDHSMTFARGAYLLALHTSRVMMTNPGPTRGHLIFFGDWAAEETPYHDYLPYLTAKAAMHFMTRAFALELAPYGILCNAISPGPTALGVGMSASEWEEALNATPLHRESSEEDIAEVITTLLKTETITGENVRVDSGRHIVGTQRARPVHTES